MKKLFIVLLSIGVFLQSCTNHKQEISKDKSNEMKNLYDYKVESLDGKEINFADFKGKKVLIVNTASECGFTPQYADLEKVAEQYKDRLVVVGFPANNFGAQEPGSNAEIGAFCQKNFGVTFPMASKQMVSGDEAHPFYLWARKTLGFGTAPKWNFHKYLIARDGALVDHFNSTTSPDANSLKDAIEKALKAK